MYKVDLVAKAESTQTSFSYTFEHKQLTKKKYEYQGLHSMLLGFARSLTFCIWV